MFDSLEEVGEAMRDNESLAGNDRERFVVANHTRYHHEGGENYEHDDTGSLMNYSGVQDTIFSAEALHQDWEPGFDY